MKITWWAVRGWLLAALAACMLAATACAATPDVNWSRQGGEISSDAEGTLYTAEWDAVGTRVP